MGARGRYHPGDIRKIRAVGAYPCEQREVRSAVEGQGFKAPASAPPHEVASFLMQPALLEGRDLAGRAFDQRGQVLAGEAADLDAPTLCLRFEH